ncbi:MULTISPECIES: DLW-39 family protein [Amycolatopsis]|uniref:Uncharacterized protein n=1 Tax=Amycolatopsis cihanbeyliensis TaxID=1128664 RepID=A0A542DLM8_AMYCI|nr:MULTISPECIES: DLW-39 family protein [Amycolatopsis]TQJ03875.1 hypothetical protein FB471_3646 [Amycolatopsis cihanbeyliensis]
MKKLLALAVIAGGVLFAVKRNKDAKAEADLWREATAPTNSFGDVSSNGSAPSKTSSSDATRNN